MARLCQVCALLEAKYKCPACRAPYCSAACFKRHKETPCAPASDAEAAKPTPDSRAQTTGGDKADAAEDDDAAIDPTKLLTQEQLSRLRQSVSARQHLANAHIRELLNQVDSASNRMKALEKALLDPIFSNFMFRALDEIETPTQ